MGVGFGGRVAPEEANPGGGVLDGLQRRRLNKGAAHVPTVRCACVRSSVWGWPSIYATVRGACVGSSVWEEPGIDAPVGAIAAVHRVIAEA